MGVACMQKAESRRQKAEGRRQKAEGGEHKAENTCRTAFCLLLTAFGLLLTACCVPALGQLGAPQGNSPLYSSRPYSPAAPTGLPAALEGIGIDQRLNEHLPLDATFHDENGTEVKLGQYFGKRPVVLALVYYDCPMLCTQILNGMV